MVQNSNPKIPMPLISAEERNTLQAEYATAHQDFQHTNSTIWQTFSMVTAVALAGLAFVGTLKSSSAGNLGGLLPTTLGVGLPIVAILVGWLVMVYRWEDYAQVNLYRMREIESTLKMYRTRYGSWLRRPLGQSQLAALKDEERKHYDSLHKAFPRFPSYHLRQRVLITIIALMLIAIWVYTIVAAMLQI